LIVGGVAGERACTEKFTPSVSCPRFQVGAVGEVRVIASEVNAESVGNSLGSARIVIGGRTQTVVDVDSGYLQLGSHGERKER
jgi:hypothetical protein